MILNASIQNISYRLKKLSLDGVHTDLALPCTNAKQWFKPTYCERGGNKMLMNRNLLQVSYDFVNNMLTS